jgi:hypothetical protein
VDCIVQSTVKHWAVLAIVIILYVHKKKIMFF